MNMNMNMKASAQDLNYPRILLVGKKYCETPSTFTLPAVHGWETQVKIDK